ncbi:MAG: pseudouridine synthase [Oscillatoriales cyanobacterium RM2_1_1]|nr:pseudouridine synthase [Oscillatoriales cyanobacterium SM2_3_0]NJO44897.1 pseudouridine synthase [Oscillatoriales cyanobacterium RM2_1_1]
MPHRYILFHKPYNVLSQFTDRVTDRVTDPDLNQTSEENGVAPRRQTLRDYLSIPDVYPVGRLDQDSEGLLLLTDHAQLQHRLSHPQFHHPRTYWVQVERIPDTKALERLETGVAIKGYQTQLAQVRVLPEEPDLPPRDPPIRFRKTVPTSWLELILTEGKNRQVRRMTAAVGFPTLRLVRIAIADLTLTGLAPGQWRDLTPVEIDQLLQRTRHYPGRRRVSSG